MASLSTPSRGGGTVLSVGIVVFDIAMVCDGFPEADSKTRAVRFADENERRYKTIPLHPSEVAGTPVDLNWG